MTFLVSTQSCFNTAPGKLKADLSRATPLKGSSLGLCQSGKRSS